MTDGGFLSDLVKAKVAQADRTVRRAARQVRGVKELLVQQPVLDLGVAPVAPPSKPRRVRPTDPCVGCPAESSPIKVPPLVPAGAVAVALADMPMPSEVRDGELRPVSHPTLAHLIVGHVCVTRCRPPDDEDKTLYDMRRHCRAHLIADFAAAGLPVIALGDAAVQAVQGTREHGADFWRGLWFRVDLEERVSRLRWVGRAYAYQPKSPRGDADLVRFIRGLDPANAPQLRDLRIVTDPREEPELMEWLAVHPGPWAFDIESYDAQQTPSRKEVSTDACHPDFRVRGVAIAWSEDEGAWLELDKLGRDVWRTYLDPIFGSSAVKCAHNGHGDEDGLVYNGWCAEVVNRKEDSMLAMVSLSDGRHPSLRLERIAVDVIGADQWWEEFDKGMIRDADLEQVARAAVFDAGLSLWIVTHAQDMMESGQYWDGQ